MMLEPTQAEHQALAETLEAVGKIDPNIAAIVQQYGVPEPRFRAHGFTTLLRIIVSQQLSTKAAASIWGRIEALFSNQVNHSSVLKQEDDDLRACGLSWRKVEYSKALAARFESGDLNADDLVNMDTEQVIKELTTIKGFGVWSAEIYAMFALRHEDVFPAGDLALQVGIQRLLELKQRPTEKQAREIAVRWSPYRSSVSLMLWKYYGAATLS